MKKKFKDLTVYEITQICEHFRNCKICSISKTCIVVPRCYSDSDLDKEIVVDD